jgi:2-polyprenyl-6-methoxyphenol hydroxylase-like FAD-dependent oxidoreductase
MIDSPSNTGRAGIPDVLIVGAGPTGLVLAAQLRMFGVNFRIIDRLQVRTHESRALGVQARTLELLQVLGLGESLAARGNTSTEVVMHLESRQVGRLNLGAGGATDTRFPFILFVSQAETEAILNEHLLSGGVKVERGVELTSFVSANDGVKCELRHANGEVERAATQYLVGCDGAHSGVRKGAGIPFEGGSYPQEFVLGDVEAEGLESGAINSFAGDGVAMFFPLGRPTTWRVIAMSAADARSSAARAPSQSDAAEDTRALSLDELQAIVDAPTGGRVRLRDPAWLTRFRLHHRQTARYRLGRVFLAGDAAHVHSPVGAQGMNTGIQDAWNLGWKLALVVRGHAPPGLLDTYEAERWPVGRFLLRYTDRIFATFTRTVSGGNIARWVRRVVMPRVIPLAISSTRLRRTAFRFVSELNIRYRDSPAVREGSPGLHRGPQAGDRLPDALVRRDGRDIWLQEAVGGAHYSLLLCGDSELWDEARVAALRERFPETLRIQKLTRHASPGALVDASGKALALLGVEDVAQYLVRPDGYVAYRCAGHELQGAESFLSERHVRL